VTLNDLLIPYQLFMLASSTFVLAKGGAPERYGAVTIICMAVFQIIMELVNPSRFINVDGASLGADLIGFFGFGVLALHARRVWPVIAVALQMIALCAHYARWASLDMSPAAYSIMRNIPTTTIVALMLAATITSTLKRRRGWIDMPWQNWSEIRRLRSTKP